MRKIPATLMTALLVFSVGLLLFRGAAYADDILYSMAVRNARLNVIEQRVGPNPVLRLCGGPTPASSNAADGGPQIARVQLPADWVTTANNGFITKVGTWQAPADRAGTITHFRIYGQSGTTSYMQGDVTPTGDGGVLTIPNPTVSVGDPILISTFSIFEIE
jgi:hypothetical protein